MAIFADRNKMEKLHLDELTKIGNLFDTLNVDYCVLGNYALLSYGIKSKGAMDCTVFVYSDKKNRIIEMLFKLNYTISSIDNNSIRATKDVQKGMVIIDFFIGKEEDKKIVFTVDNKKICLDNKFFTQNRKEIKTRKGSKGYFRIAPLELIYFSKMNIGEDKNLLDLEMIKASSKMDIDKLMEIFEINGLM